jgi:hypothetical protein
MRTAIDASQAIRPWVMAVIREARATRGHVRRTRARSAGVRRDTLALIVRGMSLRGMRLLSGGSDGHEVDASLAGLVGAILVAQHVCLACLATKVDRPKVEIVRAMGRMAGTIRISVDRDEACSACGSAGPVYSLKRD